MVVGKGQKTNIMKRNPQFTSWSDFSWKILGSISPSYLRNLQSKYFNVTIFIAIKLEKVTRQLTLNWRVSIAVVIRSFKILPFERASQNMKKSHEELSSQEDLLGLLFCSQYLSPDSTGIAVPSSRLSDLICKAFTIVSRKLNTLLPVHSGAGVTFPLT